MSFCRITGRSRGLPKPNYFPLLCPISPADAKRCCRITGKSYGLPSHHYIPVLLTGRSSKAKCKITNVSGELGPHHYSPEINYGNRKHDLLPDYRYIFPVLDGSTEAQKGLMEMLLGKQVTEDKRYVYTVQERKCSLVFSAHMEAAVRDGDVRDVMLAKDSDTVLIKTKQGRSVSMDFKEFTEDVEMFEGEGPNAEVLKQREIEELEDRKKKRKRAVGLSSMKKIFETKERLAEVEELEEEKLRQERKAKKAKLEETKYEKHDVKSFSYSSFNAHHMRSKSSIIVCGSEWREQIHPLIESWDWETFDKDITDEVIEPKVTKLPTPVKIAPYHSDSVVYGIDRNISEVSTSLENVPCVNPLKPIKARPIQEILSAVKEISKERLNETADVTEKLIESDKINMLPTIDNLPELIKNMKKGKREKIAKITGLTLDINKAKKFIPGQVLNTPQGPVFIPGQTVETPNGPLFVPGLSVNTPAGPGLIPGHIVTNENNNEPFFLAGQVMETINGEEFVCGQTIKSKDESYRFVEGQTVLSEEGLKFVPGKIINTGPEDVFVPGQTLMTPDGVQFVPGQTITEENGVTFTPGQNAKINNEWQFVPGQVLHLDDELHFVPGATIATPNGLKFIPGQTVTIDGESLFVPGITKTRENNTFEFVPGTTVDTVDGPKFIEGQIVHTGCGDKFLPGKTIVQADGHVEFSIAKSVQDITFSEGTPVGLPIDIKTCSISEESLYVFGHMVQTAKGIEFYPGSRVPKLEGKVVPGRLVKNETNQSRFVPGMMVEGIFVPGQIVYTENGEQFVPGQVIDTVDGPKFVPGQVVNTKSGPKFVPGQTIHTIDGPRFVPGQIIETKAGPTFIPGQVISTEDEGSRFVPGQVVDTEEGPRFVPGRVIETDDNGVTFVPGQIVQTPEGLKFVAPDLTEGEEGLEFSVQSFVVTPEELKLLKVKTNPNDTSSTKGELTIDTKMLRQLSEAGMSIGRQVPADLPAINVILNHTKNVEALKAFVTDFGLKDEVANQLMEVITSIIEMSAHLKSELHDNNNSEESTNNSKKGRTSKKKMGMQENIGFTGGNGQSAHQEHVKNSIAAAVLAALVTAEQFEEVNNNNSKEKYQMILKSIDTILGKTIDENFVSAMFNILQKEEDKENLCEEILENSSEQKVELMKIALNNILLKHSIAEEDIIEKFGDFLTSENEVLGPAFKNISKGDTSLLRHVLDHISESISFIKTDHEATETLQKAIVSAVQETSSKELKNILEGNDEKKLKELIIQSVGLAKILGMRDVATNLMSVVKDKDSLAKISTDDTCMNILKRITVMRKLADKTPSLHSALRKLETDPEVARTDPNLRDLVRESVALMIVPEEPPLLTSADVPLSLLQPENSLAMEDFLFQRKKHVSGALLIMKKGLQAVVPREASRAVLTGQIAYTVLDENGIRHFEPLHVFSALNLSQPTAHRFSMYSCPVVDDNDEDLQTFTGYCNISNNQRITRLGGWSRRYSGVLLDRENTRSRMSSLDNTPSYKRYSSRSLSRSRSSCSRSPPKVEDVVVASADYTAAADDEVSLKSGDIVEVLDTKSSLGSKNPRLEDLNVEAQILDSSAAKHKISIRPKKNHPRSKSASNLNQCERWLVRVIEDMEGGELKTRQGWVPSHVLEEKQAPERDQTALAARRQAVVRELIETEEEFGRDMQQVVSKYMRPTDKASTPKSVFDNRELLFSNFRQICEFHNTVLLEGIKYYAEEPKMLGRTLLRMEREFDKHVAYCRDEPRAQHLLATDPVVKKYFQNLADKLGDDKGITEHLKLPIQRINDYQLLLKELVKYSKRLGEDCTDLQKALELFLGVPNRATDNKFVASIEGFRGNIYKLGRLLTHDWFTVTDQEGKSRERYLFLFKARILVCKVKRVSEDRSVFVLKDIIRLPDVEVKEIPSQPLKFELHHKLVPLYITLGAHKEHVKTTWLSEIRQHASDVVALAEHAADDLQVLPPEEIFDSLEENTKKREYTEDTSEQEKQEIKEKRSKVEKVEETPESTKEESSQHLKTKRKATLESAVAKKISKTQTVEVISVSETQESVGSEAKSDVTSDLESKSFVTANSLVVEAESATSQSESEQTLKEVEKAEITLQQQSVQESQQAYVDIKESSESVKLSSIKKSSKTKRQTSSSSVKTETHECGEAASTLEEKEEDNVSLVEGLTETASFIQQQTKETLEEGKLLTVKENIQSATFEAKESQEKQATIDSDKKSETPEVSIQQENTSKKQEQEIISKTLVNHESEETYTELQSKTIVDKTPEQDIVPAKPVQELDTKSEKVKSFEKDDQIQLSSEQTVQLIESLATNLVEETVEQQSLKTETERISNSSPETSEKTALLKVPLTTNLVDDSTEKQFTETVEKSTSKPSKLSPTLEETVNTTQSEETLTTNLVESTKQQSLKPIKKDLTESSKLSIITKKAITAAEFEETSTLKKEKESSKDLVKDQIVELSKPSTLPQVSEQTSRTKLDEQSTTNLVEHSTGKKSSESEEKDINKTLVSSISEQVVKTTQLEETFDTNLAEQYTEEKSTETVKKGLSDPFKSSLITEQAVKTAEIEDILVPNLAKNSTKQSPNTAGKDQPEFLELRTTSEGKVETTQLQTISPNLAEEYTEQKSTKTVKEDLSKSSKLSPNHKQGVKTVIVEETLITNLEEKSTEQSTNTVSPTLEHTVKTTQLEETTTTNLVELPIEQESLKTETKELLKPSTLPPSSKHTVETAVVEACTENVQNQNCIKESNESLSDEKVTSLSKKRSSSIQTTSATVQEAVENQESTVEKAKKLTKQNQKVEGLIEKRNSSSEEGVEEKVFTSSQTVTTEETGDDDMTSRYSRSSRVTGEYSSNSRKLSSGGRYESSSTYDNTGSTSHSRRESGSRLESSRYDTGGSIEGGASSRYESKYSISSKNDGGSKYGIESSYESKVEGSKYGIDYDSGSKLDGIASKYGIESEISSKITSKYGKESETTSKIDSIASKYGAESDNATKIDSITSKYGIESETISKIDSIASKYGKESETTSKIDSISSKYGIESENASTIDRIASKYGMESETTSKIDSIASKYGIESKYETEGRTSKYNIESSYDGDNIESVSSKRESKYGSSKNGGSTYERKYSKTSIANGSVNTGGYESAKSISKSDSQDGKPVFSKTLEGQNIEPGENAVFECAIRDSLDSVRVTWLKDNKPLTDRLMDRCSISCDPDGFYKLELKHCREDDSGLYTARAENTKGNTHCTAQLVVHELTPEERRQRNALNAPYFLVALKDTEIMENTYLRFMVRVKGDPNPEVKFFRNAKEITSDSDRVSIIRTRAEKGCYELVIPDVIPSDAGKYTCRAMNIFGEVTSEATVTVVDDKNIFGELLPGGEGLLAKGEKPTFTWKRDGQPFDPEERFKVLLGDDEDSLALVFQHVKPEDAGLYTCVAKTSTGNISCSAELTVQGAVYELHREPEKPTLVIEHREAVVSLGGSAMLDLQCKGFPKPTVVFKHDGKVVEPDTRHKFLYEDEESMSLVIKNVNAADAGEYHITASNDIGEDSTTINLIIKSPPRIKKKIENQTCMVGSTHTVTVEVEGTPSPDITFYKDGVEIKSSERIQIVKETEEIYKIIIKDAKLTDTGSYSVVAKNEVNQCSDFWQWHVTSAPRVTKKIGDTKTCNEKETVTFNIETESEPAPTVKWFKNKTELTECSTVKISSSGSAHSLVITSAARVDAGEYSCEVRNVHGSASDSCLLNVRAAPLFTQKLRDSTANEGDVNVEFTVSVEAFPEPTVRWYLGDMEISEKKSVFTRVDSGNTHKLILKEVSAEYSGQYHCKVSNDLGADSCQATFTVNRKPRFTKSLVDMTVEVGQTLKLDVEVEGCPEPKVKWFKDGKEVTTDARIKIDRDTKRLENYHLTVTLVKEEDGGEYEVRAENEMGSVSSKSTVTVHTREVHTRITKEEVENEIDAKSKQPLEEDLEKTVTLKGKKKKSEAETIEEKSFWDEQEDAKPKKIISDDADKLQSKTAHKSLTKPEQAEEKSFWDDVNEEEKPKTPKVEECSQKNVNKGKKSLSEPETVEENSICDYENKDGKTKRPIVETETVQSKKADKSITEPEIAEEKSFWDDVDENKESKKPIIEEVESPKSKTSKKSATEPEIVEEKSFWDDIDDDEKSKKPIIEEFDTPKSEKGKKSVTISEEAEEKSIWDENHNEKNKKPIIEEVITETKVGEKGSTKRETIEEVPIENNLKKGSRKSVKKELVTEEPLNAEIEGRVFETITTFKTGDDGSIIMSKVSSSRSHGAIITGPAETHTLHKMTSTAVYYDDDDDDVTKIIKPNKPHTTSLEVEEIASHSYILSELGHYTVPDYIRRGTYGIIEEPQTDSDAESARGGKHISNRTVSIASLSEDEMSWHNESLSREISIEDLSKSIFEIDETRKVFSKDSYVRESSFKEDYFSGDGDEESIILKEKSQKVYENDITEKLIHISKEFDENQYKNHKSKADDVKNRIIEELVLGPERNFDNITKNVSETNFERRKKNETKLFSLEEEADSEVEALLRRSQKQRSILDDILNQEDEKAPPSLKESSLKDGHVYESLPLVYTVQASGTPKPTVRWLHDGKEVSPSSRVHLTNDGDVYKLEIDKVDLKDAGQWQCEIINDLGKDVLKAELTVSPESELRKPKFTQPLEAQRVMQREPVTLKAVCTADPQPHVSWLLNGVELKPDATIIISADTKEIEHGLKECTFTLNIPTGRHADTGEYTIQAKNKYGVGESSARLDIFLRPEIEGLKDVTAVPYEETTFVANVRANPIAEIQWSKDGYVIKPTSHFEIVVDKEAEKYKLIVKKVGVDDAGVYTLTAKNEVGETAQQAKLIIHTGEPIFTKPLQKQTVKDYDDCTLKVRCDGEPKPEVHWYLNGKEISSDDHLKVTTEVGGQVDSELEIKHFNASDAGKYKVRAVNLAGEAECEAPVSLAQTTPGFAHKLDRQRDVDEGEPLELRAKLDGSPIPTAKWYKDGVPLPADDARVQQIALPDGTVKLSIEHVTPADCGAYKLVISSPNGENSALCAVAVNPTPRKPSFSQELADVKAVVGQPLKLEARVMAFPAPEVKWFKDGLPVRPSQAINFINQPGGLIGLSIDSCKPEDAGVYSLTVTNKLGEVGSKAKVEVQQKERKPAFIAELQPTKVIEGFPVKLEVKVLGHPPPTIKWTHNGKEIVPDGSVIRVVSQPDGTHALLIDRAEAPHAGTYAVIATNDKGDTTSTAELQVASRQDDSTPQERPQFIHGLRDVTADEGQPLTITAPFVGNPVPEVTWTKDGKPLKPNEKILLTCDGKRVGIEINPVELPDAGVYSVNLVNPLGEDSSDGKINVRKVYQPPTFSQKFTDLQQLPTFDAKFPARVYGKPTPEITWYKNDQPLRPSDKYTIKRDGDTACLYVRDLVPDDAGTYKCVAKNREGQAECEANLEVVDKIARKQKVEPPSFLKKIGDIEVFRGMSAKFTACATGTPEPDVEWFRNDEKLFPCERIRMDKESTGLLRLTISGVDPSDVATYRCRIFNPHGEDSCTAQLTYDNSLIALEPHTGKRPISDQYSDFDKMKKTGVPMPLADRPIISRMADRHLTLSWKPSIPHGPRFPVTYQVEMCELPDGDWFTARTGLRSCVCDIRNLEPFRDYKFRIRVENKYGISDPSPFAITHRSKLEPDPPKFIPYLEPGIDFRPETSPYFPKDFDIERPPHDGYAQAPRFLRQEHDSQYGTKGHNVNLFWFVYGYPKPQMTYFFNDEPIEIGGRYDWSYTRNGQATLFINKMLERDSGWYEAVATNEHGQARQRVRLELAEYPTFIRRPEETVVLQRSTARIEAKVTGVPYPDIKWYKDWQPLAPSARIKIHFIEPDTTILVIHDTILKDEGLYSVSARNVAGSVSSSAMLHVEEDAREYSERMREHPPRVKPSTKPFGEFYDLGDELGRGVQGVVYHAAERLTGRNYAAKIMHGHSDLKPFMKNELDIMNLLNDRHLIRLHEAYEHDHTVALVTELAAGGELVRDRLLRSSWYTERDIAGYIRQTLRGLKHMHDNSVAHLGLTIGELLLAHAGSDELKVCDFGLSRRIQFNKHAALDYGMPEYVAPEVASGDGVSFPADMWSIGIITYILLSGHSPFRGVNDRETLTRIREGRWEWHDEEWWSRFSRESRDFISKLLVIKWNDRMDIDTALRHPWLTLADRIYRDEYQITTDRLRNYYNLYRDWTSNAQCRTWFRRRPLSGAFDHPSKMVYPPGEIYTPEGTPDRDRSSRERKPAEFDLKFKQWDHPDWEVSASSESHYQNGPDTYLLQLRDTQFPVRLREYMKVACNRSPGYSLNVLDTYDPRTPIIRERRRFTDIMDEEIDDERRERINNYGSESYTIRRLRHELGTRLDSYAEAQAFMESKKDGQLPFFREKPQTLPVREGETAQLSCYAVGDPKPTIQWFKNDMVIAEGQRIKIVEDEEGKSSLKFEPAMHHDVGFYKVVARNKVGQTVARTRVVEATNPDAPDSPTATEISDTEVLLRWKQPKYDGNSPVVCYSLQYKEGDSVEWKDVADNIDHEFFIVRGLQSETSYQFRLSSRNRIGWSDKGIPTNLIKTKETGAPKIEVTKAMRHLQQLTESGQEIILDEESPNLDYTKENNPIDWCASSTFTDRYSFVSELWRGKFSIVVKGIDKTNDSVVVSKILENRPDTEVPIQREFECLRRLRHERISSLLGAFQVPGSPVSVLILEKLQGADILTYLSSRHDYTEQMVATIVTQILDGIQYLHWRGYCHLDLQPDNVVMASVRSIQVKLIDFGSAHKVTKLGTSVPQVGELEYKAPEIINDEPAYPQTDIWSVGILTYIMLSGVSPYRGADDSETKQNISFVRYRFEHLYKEITQEATRFLMFLFKKVPLKRPSAEECHEHRWLAHTDFMNKKRERAVFLGNRLKEFSDEYHERKAREASQADTVSAAFGQLSPRLLTRSNSIQEELLTTFSTR